VTDETERVVQPWTRGAAIRPVPDYAIVHEAALRRIEEGLAVEAAQGAEAMDEAFARFEETQPEVAARVQEVLERPLDETALALGYFLAIAVWMAFDDAFKERLGQVSCDAWRATVDAFALEEDLRRTDPDEHPELDLVLALEQPDVVAFVHEHIDAAQGTGHTLADVSDRGLSGETDDVDVDAADVQLVLRTILLETLALSHAVAPGGPGEASPELVA